MNAKAQRWQSLLIAGLVLAASSCSRRSAGPSSNPSAPSAGGQSPLEQTLQLWTSGQQEDAVAAFLKLDWNQRPFSAGSILNDSEAEFAKLPTGDLESKSKSMMADLAALKQLVVRVKEKGQQARASGDAAKARQCFDQVRQCGERLDRPDSLLLVQKVGQAFKKLAATELATLPSQ